MALIRCPECGRNVSDRAQACPECGCPIATEKKNTTVAIQFDCGCMIKMKIIDAYTEREYWEGRDKQVASFQINQPTDVRIGTKLSGKTSYHIEPGKLYRYHLVPGIWANGYALSEVSSIMA